MAGLVICTYHPSKEESINRRIAVQPGPDIKRDPISKTANTKRAGGVAQVIAHLPSNHKALSSIPGTAKKQEIELIPGNHS
jgi:hypothetical protein